MSAHSLGEAEYFLTLISDSILYTWVHVLKHNILNWWKALVEKKQL